MKTTNRIKKTFVVTSDLLYCFIVILTLLLLLIYTLIQEVNVAEDKIQTFYRIEHKHCQFKDSFILHIRSCQVLGEQND